MPLIVRDASGKSTTLRKGVVEIRSGEHDIVSVIRVNEGAIEVIDGDHHAAQTYLNLIGADEKTRFTTPRELIPS